MVSFKNSTCNYVANVCERGISMFKSLLHGATESNKVVHTLNRECARARARMHAIRTSASGIKIRSFVNHGFSPACTNVLLPPTVLPSRLTFLSTIPHKLMRARFRVCVRFDSARAEARRQNVFYLNTNTRLLRPLFDITAFEVTEP